MSFTAVLADDSAVELDQIVPIIKRLGGTVLGAFPDGLKAWNFIQAEAAKGKAPDLYVTDYIMPLMTGAEVALAIRKALLPTRVFMWTSAGQKGAAYAHPEAIHYVQIKPYLLGYTKQGLYNLGLS